MKIELETRVAATSPSPRSPNHPETVRIGSANVPSPAPSKVVAPIVTSTSAIEPGAWATQRVAAESARRTPSCRSRTSSGASVENIPK